MNDGEPAFPYSLDSGQSEHVGMTLRDYFAGQAFHLLDNYCDVNANPDVIATFAYKVADAMLKAREIV